MSKVDFRQSNWFAVETYPHCEERVRDALSHGGFGVYLPQRKIEAQHRRTKAWSTIMLPLMQGYLFAEVPRLPVHEHWTSATRPTWQRMRRIEGVCEVLGNVAPDGEWKPIPISSDLIERLMAMQLGMAFDDTREAKIRRNELGRNNRETMEMFFPAGCTVRASDGPLAGMLGEVVGVTSAGMIEALVEMLGRMVTATFPARDVEFVAA